MTISHSEIHLLEHTTMIRVRYADTDQMGVVYNGNYLTYFEVARTELLRSIGLPYRELEKNGCLLPLTEATLSFIAPARYDDILEATATLHWKRTPTIRIAYHIACNNADIAKGHTTHAFLSTSSFKPIRPPAVFSEAVDRILHTRTLSI